MEDKKLKIVYNISTTAASGGGMERVVVNKINYLADKFGYDVLLITTDQRDRETFYPFSLNVRHIDLGLNYDEIARAPGKLKSYFLYRKALKLHRDKLEQILISEKADVVVSMGRDEKEFLYKINDGSRKILESHRCLKPRAPIEFRRAKSLFQKIKIVYRLFHETRLPKFYDRFIVLTEEDKSYWSEKKNVIVIPNPLPFETSAKPNLSSKRVLCVGRISTDKGVDRLLNIWSKVQSNFPDWRLSLFGEIVDEELIDQREKLNLSNSVEFISVTPHILNEYLNSSIYVMTSRFEGLPMVLLEAISVGLPIVSYAFKCGPKDVIEDGENGFLVNEDDETTFVEKLEDLMNKESLRVLMSEKSKESGRRFSEYNVMNKWNELFHELIGNNG